MTTIITSKSFEDLMFSGNSGHVLPTLVLESIKLLCDELGYNETNQNTYVNQYNANVTQQPAQKSLKPREYDGRTNFIKQAQRKSGIKTNDWKLKPGFTLTKFALLDDSQQLISEIRTDMNKITEKNLTAKLETLRKHINEIMDSSDSDGNSDDEDKDMDKMASIMDVIYAASIANKLPALYSKVYETAFDMYPKEVEQFIEKKLALYLDSMNNIVDVSEQDYDRFCEFNLENTSRKNTTALLCEIANKEKITNVSVARITDILSNLLEQVLEKMEHKIKHKEVEEITENVVIIMSLGKIIEKEKYLAIMRTIIAYKSGEKPGLTSRTRFKYMDLVAMK